MASRASIDSAVLREGLERMRSPLTKPPVAAVVFPVNAQGDLENVLVALGDVARYRGERPIEVVLVVNNYATDEEPSEVITKDKKNLLIDNYSMWRIANPLLFFQTVRSERGGKGIGIGG